MRMTKRAAAAVLAGAIAITACGSDGGEDSSTESAVEATADSDADSDAPVENSLLSGTVSTVTGSQVDLAGFEGKDVLLWVWAPW